MDLRESIKNQTDVSLQLTKHISLTHAKDSNLVYSPLSIHVVLSLIAAGSKGETLDQLLSFLRSKSNGDLNTFSSELVGLVLSDGSQAGGPKISFANGVWIEKALNMKDSFKNVVAKVYKASSKQVDFKTKKKKLLVLGDSLTRLVLANALYFKGAWNEKFDPAQTKDHDFHLNDGTSIPLSFMTSKRKQYVRKYDGFKVLGLPYKQGEDKRHFSMYFILPGVKDGMQALVEKVGSESGFLGRHLPVRIVPVGEFRIPKFKISFGFDAVEVLKGLGLVSPFSGGLTEVVDSVEGQKVYVSIIFHASFIEVNDEGAEATAASAAVLRRCSLQKSVDFVADHPFIFLIREDITGVFVFIRHPHV